MTATDVGMNLSSVSYYSTEAPFIDRFKMSSAWYAVKSDYTISNIPIPLDSNGYPTGTPSDSVMLCVNINVDDLSVGQSNRYVLSYSGSANISIFGGDIVSQSPGQIVFDNTRTDANYVIMSVYNDDPNNPVNNVHLVRQDQMPLFQAGEIFNPAFLDKADNWNTLRYMDWEQTNASSQFTWAQRTTPSSSSWAAYASTSGVPIEVMVALANETHTDMWFNVPTQADDEYVRKSLTYIRDNLDPSLKVKVEYSNEVWNWGFDASQYARSQALALFGDNSGGMWMQYYGYRSAQVASIAKTVFGASGADRLDNVLSTQTDYLGLTPNVVQGVARAGLGTVGQLFNDFAITTYFGRTLDVSSQDPTDQATMLSWARSGAAGLTAAFNELQFGGALHNTDSLAAVTSVYAAAEAFASANGLQLVAYEGGAHLTANFFPTAVQGEIVDFIGRLMADPRMGQLYTQMVQDFTAAGGTELTAFGDVGGNGTYGYWGVLDDIYQSSSPRYDALAAAATAAGTSGAATAAAVPTTSASTISSFKASSWASLGARGATTTGTGRSGSVVSKELAAVDVSGTDDTVDATSTDLPAATMTLPAIAASAAGAASAPTISTAAAAASLASAIVSASVSSSASSAMSPVDTTATPSISALVSTPRKSASAMAALSLRSAKFAQFQDFAL